MALPVFVVHGWWISKLLVLAGAFGGVLVLLAVRPYVRETAPSAGVRAWFPACALVGAVVAYFGLRALGQHYLAVARGAASEGRTERELRTFDPLVVAAALPGVRDDALDALGADLLLRHARTRETSARRAALQRMRWGCGAAVRQQLRDGQIEDALAESETCTDRAARASALVMAGHYAELAENAALATVAPRQRLLAMIATRRWLDAAAMVEELAPNSGEPDEAACLAGFLRALAGAAPVAAGVRSASDATSCAAVHALARVTPAERTGALVSMFAAPPAVGDVLDAHAALRYSAFHDDDDLRPWVADRLEPAARAGVWSVVRDVYRGDFAAAETTARQLSPELIQDAPRAFEAIVALRRGRAQLEADWARSLEALELRTLRREHLAPLGIEVSVPALVVSDCRADGRAAIARAVQGDGRELAALVEECQWTAPGQVALLAVAPRIEVGRERLARALSTFEPIADVRPPFALVAFLAWQRDLLNALGDAAGAARRQVIIDRHLAAFDSLEQLVALRLSRS